MTTKEELHPEPVLGVVFVEQLRAVGLGARREFSAFGVLMLALSLLLLAGLLWYGPGTGFDLHPGLLVPFMIAAAFVPLGVWRAENPERRTYLWSVPLSRRSGHLLRLASGWLWTMVAVGFTMLWGLVMALVTDGLIWKRTLSIEMSNLAPDAAFEISGGLAHYVYQLPAWLLLAPFALATILYLVGSTIILSTNHPLRWGAILVLAGICIVFLTQARQQAERKELRSILGREPPIEQIADEDTFLERLLGNEGPYGLGNLVNPEPVRREIIPGTVRPLNIRRASFSNWLSATALWGCLALIAACIAASTHRDP